LSGRSPAIELLAKPREQMTAHNMTSEQKKGPAEAGQIGNE
jgi:hypothetical protein